MTDQRTQPDLGILSEVTDSEGANAAFQPSVVLLKYLIFSLFALRILFLLFSPLELISDEAYYWDWSRQLDWCYFSKPPMIAWLIRLTSEIFGDSTLALRGTALILAGISSWFIYDLSRMIYGKKTALTAVTFLMLTPGHIAQSAMITIDAPFLCFFCGAMWGSWRWSTKPGLNLNLMAMLLFLLAGILSKQTMLGFIPLFILYLSLNSSLRKHLFSLSSLLVFITGGLGVTPLILWNSKHNWVTFQHTASHFAVEEKTLSLMQMATQHLEWFAEFQASQFFLLSPFIWIAILLLTYHSLKQFRSLESGEIFLICFSIIPLSGLFFISLRQHLEPNWGAAFYPAGIILFAAVFCGVSPISNSLKFSNRFKRWAMNTGVISTSICYFCTLGIGYTSLAGTKYDFTNRMKGWKQLAMDVDRILPEDVHSGNTGFISTTGRSIISELAYYLPAKPAISRFNSSGHFDSQYDVWGMPEGIYHKTCLLISVHGRPLNSELQSHFSQVSLLGSVKQTSGPGHEQHIDLWLAQPFSKFNQQPGINTPAETHTSEPK